MLSEESLVGRYILNGGPGGSTSKLRFVGSDTLVQPLRRHPSTKSTSPTALCPPNPCRTALLAPTQAPCAPAWCRLRHGAALLSGPVRTRPCHCRSRSRKQKGRDRRVS